MVEGVSLVGVAHGHTERGRSFVSVKLGGEPEQVLACMRQMHKITLKQEKRVFSRMRWSPLPQDGSPV